MGDSATVGTIEKQRYRKVANTPATRVVVGHRILAGSSPGSQPLEILERPGEEARHIIESWSGEPDDPWIPQPRIPGSGMRCAFCGVDFGRPHPDGSRSERAVAYDVVTSQRDSFGKPIIEMVIGCEDRGACGREVREAHRRKEILMTSLGDRILADMARELLGDPLDDEVPEGYILCGYSQCRRKFVPYDEGDPIFSCCSRQHYELYEQEQATGEEIPLPGKPIDVIRSRAARKRERAKRAAGRGPGRPRKIVTPCTD